MQIEKGKIYAIMGSNGSGKSTLAQVIMGNPEYKVTEGAIKFEGKDILKMSVDQRAKNGIFLAFQYPLEIPGVSMSNFLRLAYNSTHEKMNVYNFRQLLREKMKLLKIHESFIDRNLNEGFSGGEKKKIEVLQMAILNPKLVILDETDSGLDVDALKTVFMGIQKIKQGSPDMTVIVISHYNKVFKYMKPDKVIILSKGKVTRSGDFELAELIEKQGYKNI